MTDSTADEVRADVGGVTPSPGPRLMENSSHEATLPNVPMANVAVLADPTAEN